MTYVRNSLVQALLKHTRDVVEPSINEFGCHCCDGEERKSGAHTDMSCGDKVVHIVPLEGFVPDSIPHLSVTRPIIPIHHNPFQCSA